MDSDGEFPLEINDSDEFQDALSYPIGFLSFAENRSRFESQLKLVLLDSLLLDISQQWMSNTQKLLNPKLDSLSNR